VTRNLLLPVLCSLIIFGACEKAPPCPPDEYYTISEWSEAQIPYTGYDTLRFLHRVDSQAMDTVIFVGQGRVYDTVYVGDRNGGDVNCWVGMFSEQYTVQYKNIGSGPDMIFKVVSDRTEWADVYIAFQGEEIVGLLWDIIRSGNPYHYHELKLNGRYYGGVTRFGSFCKCIYAYYTVEYGLVRIELENQAWELIHEL